MLQGETRSLAKSMIPHTRGFVKRFLQEKHVLRAESHVGKVSRRAADLRFWIERVSSARQLRFSCTFSVWKSMY